MLKELVINIILHISAIPFCLSVLDKYYEFILKDGNDMNLETQYLLINPLKIERVVNFKSKCLILIYLILQLGLFIISHKILIELVYLICYKFNQKINENNFFLQITRKIFLNTLKITLLFLPCLAYLIFTCKELEINFLLTEPYRLTTIWIIARIIYAVGYAIDIKIDMGITYLGSMLCYIIFFIFSVTFQNNNRDYEVW